MLQLDYGWIKSQLRKRKHAQWWVARRLGISQPAVSYKLDGITRFRAGEIAVIAEILDVSVDALFMRVPGVPKGDRPRRVESEGQKKG